MDFGHVSGITLSFQPKMIKSHWTTQGWQRWICVNQKKHIFFCVKGESIIV